MNVNKISVAKRVLPLGVFATLGVGTYVSNKIVVSNDEILAKGGVTAQQKRAPQTPIVNATNTVDIFLKEFKNIDKDGDDKVSRAEIADFAAKQRKLEEQGKNKTKNYQNTTQKQQNQSFLVGMLIGIAVFAARKVYRAVKCCNILKERQHRNF